MTCERGYYCPEATEYSTQFPCPNGTFSNSTSASSVADCQACLPGQYCFTEALTAPDGACASGFYCGGGASVPTPESGRAYGYAGDTCVDQSGAEPNGVCPHGHYCPAGSGAPIPCPAGTFATLNGQTTCLPHTDCASADSEEAGDEQGSFIELIAGTPTTDAVCGDANPPASCTAGQWSLDGQDRKSVV